MAAITISQDINVDNIFNPVWVAVATGGTVGASASDPVTGASPWTARTLPSSAAWNSVCFGDKVAVAVAGSTANMGTTGDGITWYTNVLTASKVWQSVCYGNGTFVVVAKGDVLTNVSTDGTLFTAGGNQQDAANWYSVCYGVPNVLGTPTPMFVAVADTNSVVASNSTDNGASWNRTTITSGNWRSVCYGTPTINSVVTPRFVAVGYNSNKVAYSDNGTNWSDATLPNSRNWAHVIYANGVYVTCAYGTNVAAYSVNGVNWTEVTLPSVANWISISYGITSNQGLAVFCIKASANAGLVSCVSYDGINWFSAVDLNAAYTFQCYCPFPWNSGDTLTVQNNAIITVNTNQTKFWKTITGTFGKLQISNDGTLITSGRYFQMGRITGATVNAILPQSGLFSIDIDGAWIQLDVGTNAARQKFTVPFTEYIPSIEVETNVPDTYEVWCNVSSAIGPYMKILGKDGLEWVGSGHRGNYFVQTPDPNPVAIPVLTGGAVKIGSYYVTFSNPARNTITSSANRVLTFATDGTIVQSGAGSANWADDNYAVGDVLTIAVADAARDTVTSAANRVLTFATDGTIVQSGAGSANWADDNYAVGDVLTITASETARNTITSSATRILTFATDGTIVQSGAGSANWADDNYAVGDTMTITGGSNAGTFTVKAISTKTLTVNKRLEAQVADADPVVTVNAAGENNIGTYTVKTISTKTLTVNETLLAQVADNEPVVTVNGVRGSDVGTFTVKAISTKTLTVNETLAGLTANASPVATVNGTLPTIYPGANIIGTGIPAASVVNRVVSATKVELSAPCTATNTGLTLYVYNPFRAQFKAEISVGDGINGNKIPVGRKVRCANLMISDSSPTFIASTSHQTDASIDMSLAGKINAQICLFGDLYLNITQAAEAFFRHVGFAFQFLIVETYVIDFDYVGVAASPAYWYYSAKWISRDQRWGILPPQGYTAPGFGCNMAWSYMHNAKIKNLHIVMYSPSQFATTTTLLDLKFTNDSVWENIRISVLRNTRPGYCLYFSDSCFRNTITNLQIYGINPIELNLSSDNVFSGVEYSLSMNSVIEGFKTVMRIADDPATGLPLVDNTKYYLKTRSFRSWMDRTQYFDSNEYSATAFQGGWQFPDYISIRPTETIARSVTVDWVRRAPEPGQNLYEIFRSETPGFTDRTAANRVFSTLTAATITAVQGVKVRTLSNAAVTIFTFDSAGKTITRSGSTPGSWITDGFLIGDTIYVAGSFKGNDGTKTITNIGGTGNVTLTVSESLYAEVTLANQVMEVSRITSKSTDTTQFAITTGRVITRVTGWIATEGFATGDVVDITGSAAAAINNGAFTVTAAATTLTMNEPMAAETTRSISTATKIMTFAVNNTITLSGGSAGVWTTEHSPGNTIYVAGSAVGNTGPWTVVSISADGTVMTVNGPVVAEVGNASPVITVYRKMQIALRAPVPGTRYYYRFRKYNFNSIAALGCTSPGYFQSLTRVVTGGNTFTITTAVGVTTAVAHGFIAGQSVKVSGFADPAYNGTFTIATVPSLSTFTITLTHINNSGGDATSGKISAADITTTYRAVSGNVATLTTSTPHLFVVNQSVVVSGLADATYRGTFKVASVPTTTSFTYALTHADEGQTADTTGLVENTTLFSAVGVVSRVIVAGPLSTSTITKTMTFTANNHKIVFAGGGNWTTDGFLLWDTITISGSQQGNNGTFTISALTTTDMTVLETIHDEVGSNNPVITVTAPNMATLNTSIAHGLVFGQTFTVYGVGVAEYNGTFNARAVAANTIQYPVNHAIETSTPDNGGKITNPNLDFDNVYYLSGFQFASGTKYITNLVNNIYNSMFAPDVYISGRGIAADTKVVEVDLSGRWMTIDKNTTTSSDAIFAVTFAIARKSLSSNVATIVTQSAHNLEIGDKIRITGMTDSSYNGTFVVTVVPSNTRIKFALTHADDLVELVDNTGIITVIDLCLTIPAQTGMAVYGAPGTTAGIQVGAVVVSKESSSMITLSQKPTWAIQYTNVFFQTFTESSELTCVPNYYPQTMNYCLQNRDTSTTWGLTNMANTTANTYQTPTMFDWSTKTMDLITAGADGGFISQTISNLLANTDYTFSIAIRADQTQALPNGVAGTVSLGATNTAFTATNDIKRWSATVNTGAGTSLVAKVTITTNTQAIHIGDAMVNAGTTMQSPIPTLAVPVAIFPQATPLVQLRSYCRPEIFCGTHGNQGIEINLGTADATTYFTELHISPNANFSPSASTLAATTFAADTVHFYLLGESDRNEFSNIVKVGGGAAAAALSIFYLNTTSTDNVFKDCHIDMQYCNHATVPAIYAIASSHNNLFHNIDFGRVKNYLSSSTHYQALAINAITGTKVQNIRADNYDFPISNESLNATMKGLSGGRSTPATTATTWALASTTDGLQGVAPTAVYGSQFYDVYTSPTQGALQAVMEDSTSTTKPYTIKAGTPKFTNTGRLETVNANSVVSVSRARAANVATIVTALPHKIISGDEIAVSGLGGTGYNGTQTVTSVPTTTSFTYANTGSAEGVTADTAGSITVGDSIEFTWPYQLLEITGFRKLFPKFLQNDLGTQTDFPESIKVEVSIKALETDEWSAYVEATPANLNALSVSPTVGFYFKFKLTTRLFMKYGTMTNPMLVGDIIKGSVSRQTAVVVANYNYGLTGTLILKNISGLFLPGELLVDGTGATKSTTYRAVTGNVATITTSTAHGMNPGYWVTISGMADTTYNGNYIVTTAPTPTTFTYALIHGNEGTTADGGGTIIVSANRATNVATNGFAVGPSLTSYVSMIQFFTSYTDNTGEDNLYPSNNVNLILNQLQSSSTVGIFNEGGVELKSGLSTTSYTYSYGWFGVSHAYSYRVRKAGYGEIDVNWDTESSDLTIPVFQTIYRTVVDAHSYTGITIDGGAKTITVTEDHTLLQLYDYAQYWSCLTTNISYQVPLTISVDEKTIIVTSGWVVTVTLNAKLSDPTRDISGDVGAVVYTSGGTYQDVNEADWESSGSLYYASSFTHTVNDGTNPITSAQLAYFDSTNTNRTYNTSKSLVTSLTTNGSGVATGYAVYKIDSNTYTGHYVRVRKYGYQTSSGTRTVNGNPISDSITLNSDNFATDSESTVAAFTGIALDYNAKSISITANHTLNEIYEYIKYSDYLTANMNQVDTISTSDGVNFALTANWGINIADNKTVTATGKKLVMSGTGTYNLNTSGQFVGIMADATKTRVPVTLTGIVVGSRCFIEKQSTGTVILNQEASGSSITTYYELTADTDVYIRVRKSSSGTKYVPYELSGTITVSGLSVTVNQTVDTIAV